MFLFLFQGKIVVARYELADWVELRLIRVCELLVENTSKPLDWGFEGKYWREVVLSMRILVHSSRSWLKSAVTRRNPSRFTLVIFFPRKWSTHLKAFWHSSICLPPSGAYTFGMWMPIP